MGRKRKGRAEERVGEGCLKKWRASRIGVIIERDICCDIVIGESS